MLLRHARTMHGGPEPSAKGGPAYEIRSAFFAPSPSLQGCLTSIYRLELEVADGGVLTDQLQPEWGSARFFAGQSPTARVGDSAQHGISFGGGGPTSHPTYFTVGTTKMWGIGLLPLGWARLVQGDASTLANRIVDGSTHPGFAAFAPLQDVLCADQGTVEDQYRLILATLEAAARPHKDEAKIERVHKALFDESMTTVAAFAKRAELSVRSLERVCARHFGFAPKILLQRQRFMRSLTDFMLARTSKWSEVLDQRYHDQAQFSREFKLFMGVTPREYADQPHPFLDAFIEARAKSLGSPALTLDPPAHSQP